MPGRAAAAVSSAAAAVLRFQALARPGSRMREGGGVGGVFLLGWPLRASTSEPWHWTIGAVVEGLKKLASCSVPALTGAAVLFIRAPTVEVRRWSGRGKKKHRQKRVKD